MLPVSTKAQPLTGLSTKKPPLLGGFFLPAIPRHDASQLDGKPFDALGFGKAADRRQTGPGAQRFASRAHR